MADRPADLDRWRLVLGRFAEQSLGSPASAEAARRARLLDHLYGRGPAGRGVGDIAQSVAAGVEQGGAERVAADVRVEDDRLSVLGREHV